MSNYGFNVTVSVGFDDAVARVTEELQKEGFGVLTEIDVPKVMKAKLDIDRSGYKILGACNPDLAHQAIDAEPDIGLLLPCNVLLREEDNGDINIGFMDPIAVLTLVDNPKIAEVAPLVREKLQRVASQLTA